jgi:hypothetical protein
MPARLELVRGVLYMYRDRVSDRFAGAASTGRHAIGEEAWSKQAGPHGRMEIIADMNA